MRAVSLSLLVVILISAAASAAQPELRGIWAHATAVKTPAEADALIAKIDRANFNAVFLLVFYWGGEAYFRSSYSPMGDGVQAGYDPLEYMTEECHKRGIQVHAWFVNGAYGAGQPKHVLDAHPTWAVDDGAGGAIWYDFGKQEVRRFQSDLMIECLRRYDVDGLHLDYIRYGPHLCYCDECQREFAVKYNTELLTPERRKTFPVAVSITANPLLSPKTATVLATFSDGTPAIAVNMPGKGMVLLLNWHAEIEMPPAVAQVVRLMLDMWTAPGVETWLTTTDATRNEYGNDALETARVSLSRLGHPAKSVAPDRITSLPAGSILVLPAVYVISQQTAIDLEQFVKRGGKLLIIDGPVKSMHLGTMQRLTGFLQPGRYIRRDEVIQSTGRSPILPKSREQIDVVRWKYRMDRWAEFRKWGVTELVRDVSRRAKSAKPKIQVTAAVVSSLDAANAAYQDWPRWVREKTVDFVVPMAYTTDNGELARQIGQWKTVDRQLDRITPGLSIYQEDAGTTTSRDVNLIRSQYVLCRQQGTSGNMYFSLQYLSDPLVDFFHAELYPAKAPLYVPPRRAP